MANNVHIIPHLGKWAIKIENQKTISSTHETQAEAISQGKIIAQKNSSELVIHSRQGKIRDKDSYGNDPFPPRDTVM
ncbi:MAG: DUF2188 domain-containing protein [Candidatus Moranbacteria bacterium]|nr:DUF2188 domain-containing protein [Candidatus Moranbacteria bacterium]